MGSGRLSQHEIDTALRDLQNANSAEDLSRRAQPYDFRRPDRIAKDQLRAIHLLHENFARTLSSSLSAYLRAYAVVNLVSVEQLSFLEFTQCLPSPSCIVTLGMKPYDGSAVLELNPSLVFPILETLLGGNGKAPVRITREITEIEQTILEGLFRVILQDLCSAWHQVTDIDFTIDSHETEPQLLQILAPNEAVVAISVELRLGDTAGMINIGIPCIVVKTLRQGFDQQRFLRRTHSTDEEHARMLRLIGGGTVDTEVRLQGSTVDLGSLLGISEGMVLQFDHPADRPLDVLLNGKSKFRGHLFGTGTKRTFQIEA